tara:strand:- start:1241 stop:1369 length:129 start_codon:yes stop_codon:yes gene_type:complete
MVRWKTTKLIGVKYALSLWWYEKKEKEKEKKEKKIVWLKQVQ